MHELAIESAVEDVIRQFADPLAFLRELVQNSIDAGSQEVDVRFEWDTERELGCVVVADWGEGMNREVIEERLVRLFNSTKDQDFTKIGKFGIGFVSVFAVDPEVVCIDTGRDGEYWRLLFYPDRRYELFERKDPVEGTEVRVFVRQSERDFAEFRRNGVAKLRQWCRFVGTAVRVNGEDVREPFELAGLLSVSFEEEGTRGVAAITEQSTGRGSYYNAGLLLQYIPSQWPHISFMLDSRYLEHTLTRDQVLQDVNFHRAVERLVELVDETLAEATREALATWCKTTDLLWDWNRLCGAAMIAFGKDVWKRAKFPMVGGEPVDLSTCKKALRSKRLFQTRGRAHFAHLMPDDSILLDVRPGSGGEGLLVAELEKPIPVLEDAWVQVPTAAANSEGAERMLTEVTRLLEAMGSTPTRVQFGDFDYPYSRLESRAFIEVPDLSNPYPREDVRPFDPFDVSGDVVMNTAHPAVDDAIAVAQSEPEWAAYTLLKAAALATEAVERKVLDEETDVRLAMFCLDRRDRRTGSR